MHPPQVEQKAGCRHQGAAATAEFQEELGRGGAVVKGAQPFRVAGSEFRLNSSPSALRIEFPGDTDAMF